MLFLKLSGVPHPATHQRQRQGPKSGAAWSPNKRVAFERSFPFPPIGRPGLGPGTSRGPPVPALTLSPCQGRREPALLDLSLKSFYHGLARAPPPSQ